MKTIEFLPKNRHAEMLVPPPRPAREYQPQWYKTLPAFYDNKVKIDPIEDADGLGQVNATAKMCIPFSDALNFGYIQETWCDMYVSRNEDGTADAYFSANPPLVEKRGNLSGEYSDRFYPNEFAWQLQWIPKLPDGYSILYTHPLNHEELPFYTFSGIVDADKFFHERGGFHPFLIDNSFEGFIPMGTPMFQIIPFKRDDWSSKIMELNEDQEIFGEQARKKFWGGYKRFFWSKKTFK